MKTAAKDFKMTELGPIPEDWEVKRLGALGDVVTGSTPPRGDVECWDGDYNWISAKDFKGKYIVCAEEKITAKGKSFCRLLPPDSVLVTCIASIGLNAIAKRPCATNQQINAVVCKTCDNEFLYYQIEAAKRRMMELAGQTAVPIINKGDFENLFVSIPPLPEQRKIAAALSDVDEMIAALEKLVEKKRKIKTGAMQRLLTGRTRLPGFKGEWVEKRLGEIGDTYNGIGGKSKDDFGRGPARYITFLNVLTNPVLDETLFDAVNILPSDGQNNAKKGDLFFNTSSETPEEVGICSMLATEHDELYLNSFCFGFRLFDECVFPLFLSYYFRSSAGRLLMTALAQGSTRYNLSKESFKDACIIIPPTLAEQKAIAKVLGDMDEEIAALEAELAKTRHLKQGMMQELLTGKVRLT